MLVCLNGTFIPHEEAKLPINDGGFLYGDTLFETLKARGKKILLSAEHLD
ncbi:MAG: branched-chain amino acid aminotransferase, partial [Chloroflexi bacterium]|nr:branched-chain amino acid aminotransferase [Chloroflexota bacterium]